MKITYFSNLEDVSEPSIRHFLNSESGKRAKLLGTIRGAFFMALAFLVIFRREAAPTIVFFGTLGAALGALLDHFTYLPFFGHRIRSHMKREIGSRLPAETTFFISEDKLVCEHLGTTTAFDLGELQYVSEHRGKLEISFGKLGLCVIPIRAFENDEQKDVFVSSIRTPAN